jgi:hypothetical protein
MLPLARKLATGVAIYALAYTFFNLGRGWGIAEASITPRASAVDYLAGVARARAAMADGLAGARFSANGHGQVVDVDR